MEENKLISLVKEQDEEVCWICDWCGEEITKAEDIYKVRGDYVCRECMERMYEEREN